MGLVLIFSRLIHTNLMISYLLDPVPKPHTNSTMGGHGNIVSCTSDAVSYL